MILIYIGASLLILWGAGHLFPTKGVIKGFGNISEDNKRIITMEWINEGLTLIFIGILLIIASAYGSIENTLNQIINLCAIIMLLGMSILSLLTGFKVKFIMYKLCPIIFTISAILIGLGTFL